MKWHKFFAWATVISFFMTMITVYRGKGYARVLMNEMLDRSRKLGFKEVTFTTKPEVMSVGYGLYKRMGFEEVNCTDGVASMRMTL